MEEIEVDIPFDFGGDKFFRISASNVEFQRILQELNNAKDGQINSVSIDGELYEIQYQCILIKSKIKTYNIQIEDAIDRIVQALH